MKPITDELTPRQAAQLLKTLEDAYQAARESGNEELRADIGRLSNSERSAAFHNGMLQAGETADAMLDRVVRAEVAAEVRADLARLGRDQDLDEVRHDYPQHDEQWHQDVADARQLSREAAERAGYSWEDWADVPLEERNEWVQDVLLSRDDSELEL
jgi:hypothetical protein